MTSATLLLIFIILAYLIGSLSSAIIACRFMGLPDPRTRGSGNPGATNVLRLAGKRLAICVLLGDTIKAIIPLFLAKLVNMPLADLAWVGLAAFLGHLFPLFFGFKGGKGVATALGILLVLAWPLALVALATWLVIAFLFRYSSLAAVITAVLVPLYAIWLANSAVYPAVLIMSLLLLARHINNIRRLIAGMETKIGSKKST